MANVHFSIPSVSLIIKGILLLFNFYYVTVVSVQNVQKRIHNNGLNLFVVIIEVELQLSCPYCQSLFKHSQP